jgi:hypothetical protein
MGSRLVWLLIAISQCACDRGGHTPVITMPRFVDGTTAAGIAHTGATYDAAVGDFDGDDAPDLYVGNHGTGAVLLRNTGDGRFTDVLPLSGIDGGGDQHGTGFADYDNDGLLDLIVTLGAGRGLAIKQNRLYHNEGGGRFHERGGAAGVADPRGRSRSAAWLDVDRDGWLDLLIANYASPNKLFRNRGDGSFEDVSDVSGISQLSATRVTWSDVDDDGFPDLLLSGTPHGLRLLRNEAGQRFVDWTDRAGLSGASGSVQGMAFGDYDNDGVLDLYLSCGGDFSDVVLEHDGDRITFAFFAREGSVGFDFESSGGSSAAVQAELFENGAPVSAERVACPGLRRPSAGTFECPVAESSDVLPPGDLGFFLWRDPQTTQPCDECGLVFSWHLQWRGAGDHHLSGVLQGGRRPVPQRFQWPPATGGSLWRGRRSGFFTRVSIPALDDTANGQAVQWSDVNNDGWLDLYVVDSGVDGAGGTNSLFLNDGHGGFVRQAPSVGASPPSGAGRGVGAHFFDLDSDGRQDLFLTNGWGAPPFDQGPYRLLRNESAPMHWLDVALHGVGSNRQGLGARIDIEACGGRQMRVHNGGANYFSQSAIAPHFGLGDCPVVTEMRVRWPSGLVQILRDVAVDQVLHVREANIGSEQTTR